MTEQTEKKEKCPKCGGTGIVKEKDGSVHVCYDCLQSGRLDQHTQVKDTKIRV